MIGEGVRGYGIIEEAIKWRRRGLSEPWLTESFLSELTLSAIRLLERHAWLLTNDRRLVQTRAEAGHQPQLGSDPNSPVVVVLDGTVKVFHTRWDGPNVLVNIAGPGDILNAEGLLTDTATVTRFSWTGNTTLLAIPREKFRDALAFNDEIAQALSRILARRVQALTVQRGHAGRKVEQRLWAFLVDLGRRHGTPTADGHTVLRVGLTQADLAAAVGASSNSVEAAMQSLRKAGKVTTGYTQVTLHELPTEEELDKSFWTWNGAPKDAEAPS